jgi:hypothetical protein
LFKIAARCIILSIALLAYSDISVSIDNENNNYGIQSNIAKSEKSIFLDDPVRDRKLLMLTGNDKLTGEIIREHSLVVGSKMVLVSRRAVFAWLVENIKVSAALSRVFGGEYQISPSSLFEYHGDDGKGLSVDFYTGYRDSTTTILVGEGKIKFLYITFTGSFINLMEYSNLDSTHISTQNCMYVKVNNPVARLFTDVVLSISVIKQGIMEKLLSLDDTAFQIMKTFMEDSHLYGMLQNPYELPPEDTSDLALKMRDTIISESSPDIARELGKLIERARIAVGF